MGSRGDESKLTVVSADTWIGMAFVLGGITLCIASKNG